jgi:hypothetical protein
MVNRSALPLKRPVSQPYGSMVAAPIFGLPGGIGGMRNRDYRYTRLRDASFTPYARIYQHTQWWVTNNSIFGQEWVRVPAPSSISGVQP